MKPSKLGRNGIETAAFSGNTSLIATFSSLVLGPTATVVYRDLRFQQHKLHYRPIGVTIGQVSQPQKNWIGLSSEYS